VDDQLEHLRTWLYQVLTERMWQQLQGGRPVDWTKHLRFLPEGLESRSGRKSSEDRQVHPYGSIGRVDLDLRIGKLHVCLGTSSEASIVEKMVRQPNDVPGLMLLDRLRRRGTAS
jgi:hypothetical protein